MPLITMNEYYTYAYLRKDGTPYYIGKGKDNRAYSKKRSIIPPGDTNRILILKENLTEEDAFKHEIYMIGVFGKKINGGILHNITDGGEGVSGMKHTDISKEKIGRAFRGKKLTPEHVEKLRNCKWGNSWNKGKTISQEQREKIRQTMLGVKHTTERRRRQSEAHKGVKLSKEHVNSMIKARVGRKWFNDGQKNTFTYDCPEGYTPGMVKRK
jgi:hypothetical protein